MTSKSVLNGKPNHKQKRTVNDLNGVLDQDMDAVLACTVPYTSDKPMFPGVANANLAATQEQPYGTEGWRDEHAHETQHSAWFDRDGDGVIWPIDTWTGLRDCGWGLFFAALGVAVIHLAISYPTQYGYLPDPFFRIYQARVHRGKHGSDSATYDNRGRFRPSSFEELFETYDRGNKGGLTLADLYHAWAGQRLPWDFFGWGAFAFEWLGVYVLLWPDDGVLRKEDIRRMFDGSIFKIKADEHAAKLAQGRRGQTKRLA